MDTMELKSNSKLWDSHICPENSEWLAENLEEFDQSVKEVLKLIEHDESFSGNTSEILNLKRSELKTQISEFCRLHHVLAEHYDHLIRDVGRNSSSLIKQQNVDMSDTSSPLVSHMLTPDHGRSIYKFRTPIGFDGLLSSGGGGSDMSQREGSGSSFSSSSDSDSESFNSINKLLISPVNNDVLKVREGKDSEVLLKKIADYEEELITLNKKLQCLEEENVSLKHEYEDNGSPSVLVSNLQAQLELAQHDIKKQNALLEMEKTKVVELQKQVSELKILICDSDVKIGIMGKELEATREKLISSEEEIVKLNQELSSNVSEGTRRLQDQLELAQREMAMLLRQLDSENNKVLELQEEILIYVADVSVRDDQIKELCNDIKQLESEISVMQDVHKANEDSWKADAESLKLELREKCKSIEDLNNNLDMHKQKYDMLMSEKDGVKSQLDTLGAEMHSLDNLTRELEKRLSELQAENVGVKTSFDSAQQVANKLRLRVEQLEREMDEQRQVISDCAEEKREAIRQLCFSLEHYRTGYKELCRAFSVQKRHAILAS